MLILPYDTESKSRNADFISIAYGNLPPSAPQALSPPERSEHNPSTQTAASAAPPFFYLRQSRHHNPRPEGPSNLRTLRTFGTKSRQPSHRRCVQSREAALLSYPHFVQNSVNSCGNSQEKSSELPILSTKLVTEIHNRVIHNL